MLKPVWNLDLKSPIVSSYFNMKICWSVPTVHLSHNYTHLPWCFFCMINHIPPPPLILNFFFFTEHSLYDYIFLLQYHIKLSVLTYLIFLTGLYPYFCTLHISVYHCILIGKLFDDSYNLENGKYHTYFWF